MNNAEAKTVNTIDTEALAEIAGGAADGSNDGRDRFPHAAVYDRQGVEIGQVWKTGYANNMGFQPNTNFHPTGG